MEYIYVLDCEVCEQLFPIAKRRREFLVEHFQAIAANPYLKSENTLVDATGRTIYEYFAGRWIIHWWPDHAVKEVRIVRVKLIR